MRIFLHLSFRGGKAVFVLYRAVSSFPVSCCAYYSLESKKSGNNSLVCLLQLFKYCVSPLIFDFT
jgi:hypothetical protein